MERSRSILEDWASSSVEVDEPESMNGSMNGAAENG